MDLSWLSENCGARDGLDFTVSRDGVQSRFEPERAGMGPKRGPFQRNAATGAHSEELYIRGRVGYDVEITASSTSKISGCGHEEFTVGTARLRSGTDGLTVTVSSGRRVKGPWQCGHRRGFSPVHSSIRWDQVLGITAALAVRWGVASSSWRHWANLVGTLRLASKP